MRKVDLGSSIELNIQGAEYVSISQANTLDQIAKYMPAALHAKLTSTKISGSNRLAEFIIEPFATQLSKHRTDNASIPDTMAPAIMEWIKAEAYKYKTVALAIQIVPSNAKQADEFMAIVSASSPLLTNFKVVPSGDSKFADVAKLLLSKTIKGDGDDVAVVSALTFPVQASYTIAKDGTIAEILAKLMAQTNVPYGRTQRRKHIDMLYAMLFTITEMFNSERAEDRSAALSSAMILDSYLDALQEDSVILSGLNVDLEAKASSNTLEMARRITDSFATLLFSSYLATHVVEFQEVHTALSTIIRFTDTYIPDSHVRYMNIYQVRDLMDVLNQFIPDYFAQIKDAAGAGKRESIVDFTSTDLKVYPPMLERYVSVTPTQPKTDLTGKRLKMQSIPKLVGSISKQKFFTLMNSIQDVTFSMLDDLASFNVIMNQFYDGSDRSLVPDRVLTVDQLNLTPTLTRTYASPFDSRTTIAPMKYSTDKRGNKRWLLEAYINKVYNYPAIMLDIIKSYDNRWVFKREIPEYALIKDSMSERFAHLPIPMAYVPYVETDGVPISLNQFRDMLGPAAAISSRTEFFNDLGLIIMDGYKMEHVRQIMADLLPYFIITPGGDDEDFKTAPMFDYSSYMAWGWPVSALDAATSSSGKTSDDFKLYTLVINEEDPGARTLSFRLRTEFPPISELILVRDGNFIQTNRFYQVSEDWFNPIIRPMIQGASSASTLVNFEFNLAKLIAKEGIASKISDLIKKSKVIKNGYYYPTLAAVPQLTIAMSKSFTEAFSLLSSDLQNLTGSTILVEEDPEGFLKIYSKNTIIPVMILEDDEELGAIDELTETVAAVISTSNIDPGVGRGDGIESDEVQDAIDAASSSIDAGDVALSAKAPAPLPADSTDRTAPAALQAEALRAEALETQVKNIADNKLQGDVEVEINITDEDKKKKKAKPAAPPTPEEGDQSQE